MVNGRISALFAFLVALAAPGQATTLVQADLFAIGDGLLTVEPDSGLEWLDVDQTAGVSFADIVLHNAGGWRDLGFRHATPVELDRLFAAAGIAQAGTLNPQDFGPAAQLLDLLGCTANCDTDHRLQLGRSTTGRGSLFGFGPTAAVFIGGFPPVASVEVDFVDGLGRADPGNPIAFRGFDFLGGRPVFVTGGLEKIVVHGIEGPNFLEEFAVLSETDFTYSADQAVEGVGHYLVRSVPEPSTPVLVFLGLAVLALRTRPTP